MPKLTKEIIYKISRYKNEPEWMLKRRLEAYEHFMERKMPDWGPPLDIDFDEINWFKPVVSRPRRSWEQVPKEIKEYFERIGIPKAEQEFLAGVKVQFDSSVVYGSLKELLESQGVIFLDTDTALKEHEELFYEYFGKLVPYTDNKFAALNTAVWSGGSFIYVPKGVKVSMPLHAFFRISRYGTGQFERTLIIADEGSEVEYIEGCTAPLEKLYSLHAAVVEIFVKRGASVKYSTLQNWSKNVYNLVTKRALVEEDAQMVWVDINAGSKVTMKYPSCILKGDRAKGAIYSLSIADSGQFQDTGTKMIHVGKHTKSVVITKAIGKKDGINNYRGLIEITPNAEHAVSNVSCDALLFGDCSKAGTIPVNRIKNKTARIYHEASISRVDDTKLFYLQSRGFDPLKAKSMVVSGFVTDIVTRLPIEFAREFDAFLEMQLKEA